MEILRGVPIDRNGTAPVYHNHGPNFPVLEGCPHVLVFEALLEVVRATVCTCVETKTVVHNKLFVFRQELARSRVIW